jgi:predicted nucleic acid-binding protein
VILAETSAWVEYDRASNTAVDQRLTELIRTGGSLAVTEPVLMEVLAGARDEVEARRLRRLLTSFEWIPSDAATDFEGAARLFRTCRAAGVTPRGLIDCMIATIALRSGTTVLTADRDFARIASVVPLTIDDCIKMD